MKFSKKSENGNNKLPETNDCHPHIESRINARDGQADPNDPDAIAESSARKYIQHLRWFQFWLNAYELTPDNVTSEDAVQLSRDLTDAYNGQTPLSRWREIHRFYRARRRIDEEYPDPLERHDTYEARKELGLTASDEVRDQYACTQQDIDDMIEVTPDLRGKTVIRLLWQTGLRADEAANLRISAEQMNLPEDMDDPDGLDSSDLDRDNRTITVREEISKNNQERTVAYQQSLADSYLNEWLERGRKKYRDWRTSPYLFTGDRGEQMRNDGIRDIVVDAAWKVNDVKDRDLQAVEFEDASDRERHRVTPHNIRHGFGSYLANDTPVGIWEVSHIMGHQDVETTQRTYVDADTDTGVPELKEFGPE